MGGWLTGRAGSWVGTNGGGGSVGSDGNYPLLRIGLDWTAKEYSEIQSP